MALPHAPFEGTDTDKTRSWRGPMTHSLTHFIAAPLIDLSLGYGPTGVFGMTSGSGRGE